MKYHAESDMIQAFVESKHGRRLVGNCGFFLFEVSVGGNSYQKEYRHGKPRRIDVVAVYMNDEEVPCTIGDILRSRFSRTSLSEGKTMTIEEIVKDKRFMSTDGRQILQSLKGISVWLIEAKTILNSEALGQILINRSLFEGDYPNLYIDGMGIICLEASDILKGICRKYGVDEIWEVKKQWP